MTATKKLRAGLYEIVGVLHRRTKGYPCAPVCGGQIRVQHLPPCGWESHCDKCGECDFNGYDTLKECVKAAPDYFGEATK